MVSPVERVQLGLLAEGAHGVRDAAIADLNAEVVTYALLAAAVHALQHGHHLDHGMSQNNRYKVNIRSEFKGCTSETYFGGLSLLILSNKKNL